MPHSLDCGTPGFPVHHQFPELTQTHVHWVGDAIQPSHPLCSPSCPTIRVFSNESVLRIRWPKYWSFSFSISPSNEGLISFRTDWFDAVYTARWPIGLWISYPSGQLGKALFWPALSEEFWTAELLILSSIVSLCPYSPSFPWVDSSSRTGLPSAWSQVSYHTSLKFLLFQIPGSFHH